MPGEAEHKTVCLLRHRLCQRVVERGERSQPAPFKNITRGTNDTTSPRRLLPSQVAADPTLPFPTPGLTPPHSSSSAAAAPRNSRPQQALEAHCSSS